jgi:tripartite-type tricarboxylate transporter receptor subunit TctC
MGGPASTGHIYGELMNRALGIKRTHVPYRGGAPMTTDLISGVIPVGIDVITAFVPYFKSGQIKPLAVTSAQRSPLAPDVPTVVETGHGRLVLDNFFGLTGPAKMPADVVARLNAATNEVLAMPEIEAPARARRGDHAGNASRLHDLRAQPGDDAAAGRQDRPRHALIEASRPRRR